MNKEKTVAYSSSLIQQNFGESEDEHGILLWDIKTKNSEFLIFFPDLFKEILVFEYLFQSINPYIFILVFLKIIFEIIWHTYINKNNYNNLKIFN